VPETPHLLVVEDDPDTRQSLALVFQHSGYAVETAINGRAAISRLVDAGPHSFDVVLSDISLGDTDGIAVLRAARSSPGRPEVVLITGYSTVQTAVEALRAGAYDYLMKPCDVRELVAVVGKAVSRRREERDREQALEAIKAGLQRLEAVDMAEPADRPGTTPQRAQPREERFVSFGQLQFDLFTRTASFAGRPLHLTPTEYTLLLSLGEAPGKVHTYGELVQKVYGHAANERQARSLLKGHIHNLRAKLSPDLIQAARGVGYMLTTAGE
jgi:DNA-binding response OmpR family regulator